MPLNAHAGHDVPSHEPSPDRAISYVSEPDAGSCPPTHPSPSAEMAVAESAAPDSLLNETAEHDGERALAEALAAVLSRKPVRSPASQHPPPIESDNADEIASSDLAPATPRHFVSALGCTSSEPEPEADDVATLPETAGWLAAARRRHWREAMSQAGAWVATIAIGTVIVTVAAVLLWGNPRDVGAWLDLTSRML